MSIEKSPLVRQQEEKIADLQAQIKKKNTVIKSLKTRLSNMQDRVTEVRNSAFQAVDRMANFFNQTGKEIKNLLEKLESDRRFAPEQRQMIREIMGQVEEVIPGFNGEFDGMDENAAHFADPDGKARSHDPFAEFAVAPEADDQKEIRKLYLQLSKRFHPDRAGGEAERKQYHDLQQRIVDLYNTHDLQGLTKLAMQYDLSLLDTAESETDVLEQRIHLLTRQLEGLEKQQARLSAEIKQLRKSNLGEMLSQADAYARAGMDITQQAGSDFSPMEEKMSELLDVLREVDRTGDFDLLNNFFLTNQPEVDDFWYIGDDDDDDDFYYDDDEDEDYMQEIFETLSDAVVPNPDPRYPVGSWVYIEAQDPRGNRFSYKAQVANAVMFGNHPVYDLNFPVDMLRKIPDELHLDSFYNAYLGSVRSIPEINLRKAPAGKMDSDEARNAVIRELWYRFAFDETSATSRKKITAIVHTRSDKKHLEKWYAYLKKTLKAPFHALYALSDDEGYPIGENIEVTVKRLVLDPEEDMIIADIVTEDGIREECDLIYIIPFDRRQHREIDLYSLWYGAYLEHEGYLYDF